MFLTFSFLVVTTLFSPVQSQATFDDMSDEDFESLMKVSGEVGEKYGETFARGCVKGAAVATFVGKGLPALCIGCVVNGAGDVVAEMAVPKEKK